MAIANIPKNLIIGANSFLGRAISLLLLEKNQIVEGVINKNKDKLLPNIIYHKAIDLKKLPDDYTTIYIISAFVPSKIEDDTAQKLFDVNVKLTEQIVQHFSQSKIVYASSVSVYGNQYVKLHENSPCWATSGYAWSKMQGEKMVKKATNYAIVRISSMYGEGMATSTFLPRILLQAITNNKLTIWGDGSRQQNYIAVFDVANYLVAAANKKENGLYLAVDSVSYSNLEIAHIIQKYYSCSIVFWGNDNSSSYHYDNQQTIKKLDYQPRYKLAYHIQELTAWIKKMYS